MGEHDCSKEHPGQDVYHPPPVTRKEKDAEIDRLRAENENWKELFADGAIDYEGYAKLKAENAALREALENVAKWHKRSLPTPWGHACNWCSECCNKALKPLYEIFCRTT